MNGKTKTKTKEEIIEAVISLSEDLSEILIRPLLRGKNLYMTWLRNEYSELYEDISSCGISDNKIKDIFYMLHEENFSSVREEQKLLLNCSKELKNKLEMYLGRVVT